MNKEKLDHRTKDAKRIFRQLIQMQKATKPYWINSKSLIMLSIKDLETLFDFCEN